MAYTTIKKSSDYFNTVTYSGNGSTQSITGVGFQPDFLWGKQRNVSQDHVLLDSIRGTTKQLYSSDSAAEQTNTTGVTSFNSDGFSLGSSGYFNNGSNTYVAWNWLANGTGVANTDGSISSTVSANTTSGFSIVKYTGTGSNATVGHGLGAVPKMILVKNLDSGGDGWGVYHVGTDASNPQDKYLELQNTSAVGDASTPWNDTAPTSSVFSVGTWSSSNASGQNFIAYCFADVQGFSKFGSYAGNGNADGTFVYTGFKPAFVMVKDYTSSGQWFMRDNKRDTYNPTVKSLYANSSGGDDSSQPWDMLSNGFKMRTTDVDLNNSSQSYIYMAFAEEPLVGDNPATAR